jgi:hypothetical protein
MDDSKQQSKQDAMAAKLHDAGEPFRRIIEDGMYGVSVHIVGGYIKFWSLKELQRWLDGYPVRY